MTKEGIENIILTYLGVYKPDMIGIFGSYARHQETENSDIDILVKFKNSPTLLQLIKIENELSEKLGCKVDLITEGSISNKRMKKSIFHDLHIIYHA